VFCVQSASLPGRRSLRTAVLRVDFLFLAAAHPLVGALDHPFEQLVGLPADCRQPVVERIAMACSTMRWASTVASLSLVWPTNSGSRMNTDSITGAEIITSSVVMVAGALVLADAFGVVLQARVSAMRMPASWVPPSGVGMVLQ
jgi:hypothetical protein